MPIMPDRRSCPQILWIKVCISCKFDP